MSKAILISIQPKWVEKICNGEKTIEVRKSRPKLETPFKCYIYCTKGRGDCLWEWRGHIAYDTQFPNERPNRLDGKVIGEFVCDRIDEFHEWELSPSKRFYEEEKARLDLFLKESCLTYEEVCEYRKNLPSIKPLYGWHISDLKIYDKPKELSEFKKENRCYKKGDLDNIGCWERRCYMQEQGWCDGRYSVIERPPQSYMYIEGL